MTLAEKIEWVKLGGIQKGLPEKLEEDDEVKVDVEDGRAGTIIDATCDAVWALSPFGVPKPEPNALWASRKLRSCSHWTWEIGHWGWVVCYEVWKLLGKPPKPDCETPKGVCKPMLGWVTSPF